VEVTELTSATKLVATSMKVYSLPSQIGQLDTLQKLHLHQNQLASLPTEIGQLTSLKELKLGMRSTCTEWTWISNTSTF
jgi:leucine-rich repeat protein SHOC2